MAFKFKQLDIPEVIHIVPQTHPDPRGSFVEFYKRSEFVDAGIKDVFVQANHSESKRGTLRGLHYQRIPEAQGKLLTVLDGAIFDVAVDIREGSPTFGKWVAQELNGRNKDMIYVPEGFAHGFCVTSETARVIYYCTKEYSPEDEGGIVWNDPQLNISWPVESPVLSEKDKNLPLLNEMKN